jgi:hypothetical protein
VKILPFSRRLSRRSFLQLASSGSAAFCILKSARSVTSAQANDKLNIALIGVGGRGNWFASHIPRLGQNIVALSEVNESKNPDIYQQLPNARKFRDFRRMLDAMAGGIDAVIVATPDHTHAAASAAAMRAGKHVFCEKPLTRTVHESRALRDLARQTRVATSMGNQGTAAGPFRRALELIRNGAIGDVQQVHIWNNSGGADRREPPGANGEVPDFLDWDLWLGPAAARPYHRQWLSWSQWRDFGSGQLGNWGSHSANLAFMALKIQDLWLDPSLQRDSRLIKIEASHSGVNKLSFPRWELVKWSFPARAEFPPISFTWHNGPAPGSRDLLEELIGEELDWGDKKQKKWVDHGGAIIIGAKGRLRTTEHNSTFRLLPADRFDLQTNAPEIVEPSRGHELDWLDACRGGKQPWANFDYASSLNECLMLGNVATQIDSGTTLTFDPFEMKVIDNIAADALLKSEYRNGFEI